jgi:hypothetical protein
VQLVSDNVTFVRDALPGLLEAVTRGSLRFETEPGVETAFFVRWDPASSRCNRARPRPTTGESLGSDPPTW